MIETAIETAPAHWACYLINGDASGFDYSNTPNDNAGDRDQELCDAWVNKLAKEGWRVVDCEGETYFSPKGISTRGCLACDVIDYVLHRG